VNVDASRSYVAEVQYKNDANLAARQAIYRFQSPPRTINGEALDLAGLKGHERVLDVGCGNGLYLAALAVRGHAGAIAAMDLSPGMLAAARPRNPKAALLRGDAQHLPFPDDAFDASLAMHMLYHVPDRALAIREVRRVTKPGGVVLAVTNSDLHLKELGDLFESVAGEPLPSNRLSFSLESGGAELAAAFESVTRVDLDSALVVTEVEPVLDYLRSTRGFVSGDRFDGTLDEIAARVQHAIDTDGAFRIRTFAGCFVCR
jgi:ubiquinone/menaquinone biosynthesis C-methylase UbiE